MVVFVQQAVIVSPILYTIYYLFGFIRCQFIVFGSFVEWPSGHTHIHISHSSFHRCLADSDIHSVPCIRFGIIHYRTTGFGDFQVGQNKFVYLLNRSKSGIVIDFFFQHYRYGSPCSYQIKIGIGAPIVCLGNGAGNFFLTGVWGTVSIINNKVSSFDY